LIDIARVSSSGYYKWLKTSNEQEKDYNDYLIIKEVFEGKQKKLGFRQLKMGLKDDKGIIINHKKIIRIMRNRVK
jgi:hypothetical protein